MVGSCSLAKPGMWGHDPYFEHSVIQKKAGCAASPEFCVRLACFPAHRHYGITELEQSLK